MAWKLFLQNAKQKRTTISFKWRSALTDLIASRVFGKGQYSILTRSILITTRHKHDCLPSWDKSFFCSCKISAWDISRSFAWFSSWILLVSPALSRTWSPWPDSSPGPVTANRGTENNVNRRNHNLILKGSLSEYYSSSLLTIICGKGLICVHAGFSLGFSWSSPGRMERRCFSPSSIPSSKLTRKDTPLSTRWQLFLVLEEQT